MATSNFGVTPEKNLYTYFGHRNKNVIIPSGVDGILIGCFKDHDEIETVVIPESVTFIGEEAFCGCSNLKSISFPNHLIHFGPYAFGDCPKLKSITINEQSDYDSSLFHDFYGGTSKSETPFIVEKLGDGKIKLIQLTQKEYREWKQKQKEQKIIELKQNIKNHIAEAFSAASELGYQLDNANIDFCERRLSEIMNTTTDKIMEAIKPTSKTIKKK